MLIASGQMFPRYQADIDRMGRFRQTTAMPGEHIVKPESGAR